jgi:hypothetical protein
MRLHYPSAKLKKLIYQIVFVVEYKTTENKKITLRYVRYGEISGVKLARKMTILQCFMSNSKSILILETPSKTAHQSNL